MMRKILFFNLLLLCVNQKQSYRNIIFLVMSNLRGWNNVSLDRDLFKIRLNLKIYLNDNSNFHECLSLILVILLHFQLSLKHNKISTKYPQRDTESKRFPVNSLQTRDTAFCGNRKCAPSTQRGGHLLQRQFCPSVEFRPIYVNEASKLRCSDWFKLCSSIWSVEMQMNT